MKSIKLSWIIHIFAVLHAAVALGCRLSGVDDELLLTVLTMALALIICIKRGMTIEFTAAIIIVVNILGFLLGTLSASILEHFIATGYIVNACSTAITTEILGWSIIACSKIFRQTSGTEDSKMLSSPYMKWLLLAASGIFVLRLLMVVFFSDDSTDVVFQMTRAVLSNSVSLTFLICLNILFIRYVLSGNKVRHKVQKILYIVLFIVGATLLEAFLVGFGILYVSDETAVQDVPLLLMVSLLTQVTVYCVIYMINYAVTTRHEITLVSERANMAQYRYLKLKRQVDPHFLFNSLNILDCLISDAKTDQASIYTHKLASIYRYMIKSEEEEVVPLRDEMVFVDLYVDLLKVRFPEGFDVIVDVPQEELSRFVPPCSIQLLIENATKHNTVSVDNPLIVRVESRNGHVSVSNNIIPKMTTVNSTGLGQQYIRQLYLDLSGKQIEINKTNDTYCVTLPLL